MGRSSRIGTTNQVLNNIKKKSKHRVDRPTPTVMQHPKTNYLHRVDKMKKYKKGKKTG